MDMVDKINAFLADKGWKSSQLGRAANIGPNRAADIAARRHKMTGIDYIRPIAEAIARALPDRAATLDWFVDERAAYPPPPRAAEPQSRTLTEIQDRILTVAATLGEEYALKRLLGVPEDRDLPVFPAPSNVPVTGRARSATPAAGGPEGGRGGRRAAAY